MPPHDTATATVSDRAPTAAGCLEQLHQALLDHADELRKLTIAEVGATRALTHGAQLDEPIKIVKYYADVLRDYPMTEELGEIESRGMRHRRSAGAPFGGVRQSGVGREIGVAGLEEFLERKTFAVPAVPAGGVA